MRCERVREVRVRASLDLVVGGNVLFLAISQWRGALVLMMDKD